MTVRRSSKYTGVLRRCRCLDDSKACSHWSFTAELPMRNGRRQQVSGSGYKSASAADKARRSRIAQYDDGKVTDDGKLTVGQWLDRWIRDRERDTDSPLSATTAKHYRAHVDLYLKPRLGHYRLRDLRRDHVSRMLGDLTAERNAECELYATDRQAWLRARLPKGEMAETKPIRAPKPFSAATLQRVRATLSSALGDAVDSGLLASNPATQLRLRKGKRRAPTEQAPVKVWSAEQAAAFFARLAADDHPLYELLATAATTGLRRGELCGLRWASVDLDAGTLKVEHTRTSVGGKIVEGHGKSEHSRGVVDLDDDTVSMLRDWRTRQARQRLSLGSAWAAGEHTFTRADGVPWRPDYVSREFDRLVKVYGLPRLTLHGLRHTSASILIDKGIAIEVVSKRLRHANSTITSAVYAHRQRESGKQAADAVGSAIFGRRNAG